MPLTLSWVFQGFFLSRRTDTSPHRDEFCHLISPPHCCVLPLHPSPLASTCLLRHLSSPPHLLYFRSSFLLSSPLLSAPLLASPLMSSTLLCNPRLSSHFLYAPLLLTCVLFTNILELSYREYQIDWSKIYPKTNKR